MDNGVYGLTKGQASPTTEPEFKRRRGLAGPDERPLNPVSLLLGTGCGFVARSHSGNLPHLRAVLREAIRYPGFAFVHVLAGCVTYQKSSYAEEIYQRCDVLPENYDPGNLRVAAEAACGERFNLGILYRKQEDGPIDPDDFGFWQGIQIS
jgi:2-oxoglutarate ferredoxin oxidoreductase subunit beta